ncbi:MAG: hypothetical protein Q7S11_00505 [bacterium]|nr:hypothetical protein [bacterium]
MKSLSLWKIFIIVFILLLLWFVIKVLFPLGGAVVEIESTRDTLNRSFAGRFLDIEAPAQPGKVIHVNHVNMPEPGFIVIYRSAGYTNNGQEPEKFFGSSVLLTKGIKQDFDISLIEEIKCTRLTARLHKDINKDGVFDFSTEGEYGKANMNGETRILNPDLKSQPSSIFQNFDVKCR